MEAQSEQLEAGSHTQDTFNPNQDFSNEQLEQFFGLLKNTVELHYLQMKNGIARPEVMQFYTPFLTNDSKQIAQNAKRQADQSLAFMSAIEYMTELSKQSVDVRKLAITFAGSKVLIWAEVNDDDYSSLQSVLRTASIINARLDNGFTIRPTVVEESDCLDIPSHYHPIIDKPLMSK